MCGISGFNWEDEGAIEKMVQTIAHRGPDANGHFCGEGISLGHDRLSIIDLSPEANQPMFDNEERFIIVFNGEIFNFLELKSELNDYSFKTKSDTEVILAGYKKWGKKVIGKLNGQFALAIWDKQKQELFLARDESGVKPLYYFFDGKRFIFASEIKALLTHDVPRKLNIEAFNHFLRVNYVPAPMTMFSGISKLPIGHTMTLTGGDLNIEQYNFSETKKTTLSYEKTKKDLREKTIEAVGRQLIGDVPVGVYLSGGIDSSVILFGMKQFQKNIKTFSVGFELPDKEDEKKFNHDFELAKQTANFFQTEHYPLKMKGGDVVRLFSEAVKQNDASVSNPTSIAMMFLAREAKKEVTVVLTGNGGDELFGGYERYRLTLLASYYKKIPKIFRFILNFHPKLKKLDFKSEVDLYSRFMFEKDPGISRVVSTNFFQSGEAVKSWFKEKYFKTNTGDNIVTRFMRADRNSWLPDQALELGDKMSMSGAMEERVPLLDKELIKLALTIPRSYLVTMSSTKKIFKDAFRKDLPDFLFNQPKRGWSAPGAKWLRDPEVMNLVRNILSPYYYAGTKDMFKWDELENMLDNHIDKSEYNLTLLWSIITFQAWAKEYNVVV